MISVIVPCYNVADYVFRCIDSIINQTYQNVEIILVNDGSTDNTGNVCEQIAKTDKRIRVIHKNNGGLSDARNKGIDLAKGDFISFVDADDYIERDAYEAMIACMDDKDISMVSAGLVAEDLVGNKSLIMSKDKVCLTKEEALINLFGAERSIGQSSCNKLFRRELFSTLRYKAGIVNEDMELLPQILDICNKIVLLNKPVYHYIKRAGSITVSEFSMWKYRGIENAYDTFDFCKKKYPQLIDYAHFYVMDSLSKMYKDLRGSVNYRDFRRQEYSLRFQILREYLHCIRYKKMMNECGEQVKNMAITAFFGEELVPKLVAIKQRITGVRKR